MGFFSKLFNKNQVIGEFINELGNTVKQDSDDKQTDHKASDNYDVKYKNKKVSSGFSWGPEMPDEENQYNFKGTYKEYFESIFKSEFSEYYIESSDSNNGRVTVFTFWSGSRKALVVELLSRKSSVYKLRCECQKADIPYLRYYYDYHGWWNTRAYVIQRTRTALTS